MAAVLEGDAYDDQRLTESVEALEFISAAELHASAPLNSRWKYEARVVDYGDTREVSSSV